MLVDVLRQVCRTRRLPREDAEDFCQWVHERMLRSEYRVFRLFDGRSSLQTYVAACCDRLLLDWRNQQFGKWRPSAAARAIGDLGKDFERLVYRDRVPPAEAFAQLESRAPLRCETRRRLATLLRRQPRVSFIDFGPIVDTDRMSHDAIRCDEERAEQHRRLQALDAAVRKLSEEERALLRARYWSRETLADFSKRHSIPPKVAYRRLGVVVNKLRSRLLTESSVGGALSTA